MQPSRTRRTRRAAAVIVSLALVTAACGDDDDSDADTATDGSTEEPSEEPAEEPADQGGLDVGDEMSDQDEPMYRVVDDDQRQGFLSSLGDHRVVQECVITPDADGAPAELGFPIVAAVDTVIVQTTEEPVGVDPDDVAKVGDTYFVRQPAGVADELPNHLLWMHPIHRGHPVDELQKGAGHVPPIVDAGDGVVVIDIASGSTNSDYDDHGKFITSLVNRMGTSAALHPVNVRSDDESVIFEEFDVIKAISDANLSEDDVVVMPFGTFGCNAGDDADDAAAGGPEALGAALSKTTATELVASAGNDGTNQVVYPAAYSDVRAVGSNQSADTRSCFSNFGSWVEFWAIGEEVQADLDGEMWTWSGTSFAAPQVAGVWAGTASEPAAPAAADALPVKMSTRQAVGTDPNGDYGC